jgi:hypothetical protein
MLGEVIRIRRVLRRERAGATLPKVATESDRG